MTSLATQPSHTRRVKKRANEVWISDLCSLDRCEFALADLRLMLLRGLRQSFPGGNVANSLLEDFAQEALLRITARIGSFRGDSHFETWALSIAVRVGVSELRRARWRDVSLDELMTAGRMREVESFAPPDSALHDSIELLRCVMAAMETALTPKQRSAIQAELCGAPRDEIAARLGVNRNTLYKITYDARLRLRDAVLRAGWSEDLVRGVLSARP